MGDTITQSKRRIATASNIETKIDETFTTLNVIMSRSDGWEPPYINKIEIYDRQRNLVQTLTDCRFTSPTISVQPGYKFVFYHPSNRNCYYYNSRNSNTNTYTEMGYSECFYFIIPDTALGPASFEILSFSTTHISGAIPRNCEAFCLSKYYADCYSENDWVIDCILKVGKGD